MAIGSDIKELAEDIALSHEERVRRVAEIKGQTRELRVKTLGMVKEFRDTRREQGGRLKGNLSRGCRSRRAEVNGLLKGLHKTRREQSRSLKDSLATGTAERRAAVGQVRGRMRDTIGSLFARRKEAGRMLREELTGGRAHIKSEVDTGLNEARVLVKSFGVARGERASQLRRELKQARSQRQSAVARMRGEVKRSRAEMREDLSEAAVVWRELANILHKKAGARIPVGEEIPDLETRLLTALGESPGGVALSSLAESLGVVPIVLGRISRNLIESGKIRKEGRLYFPVAGS